MKNVTPKLLPTSVTLRSARPEGGVRRGEMIPPAERGDQLTGARPGIACIATAAGEPPQGLYPSPLPLAISSVPPPIRMSAPPLLTVQPLAMPRPVTTSVPPLFTVVPVENQLWTSRRLSGHLDILRQIDERAVG